MNVPPAIQTSQPAPVARNVYGLCTLIIAVVVVLAGGIVTVVHPETLPFSGYVRDVAVGAGLLGIGHGLDANSRP